MADEDEIKRKLADALRDIRSGRGEIREDRGNRVLNYERDIAPGRRRNLPKADESDEDDDFSKPTSRLRNRDED